MVPGQGSVAIPGRFSMSGVTSADPNRFGTNSAGLSRLVHEVLQLSDEQWLDVAKSRRDVSSRITRELTARLHSGDLSERSAVERLLGATFQSLRGRLREAGGRAASLGARGALWSGAYAVAFPDLVSAEEFDMAVAPFVAVGIDCRALSQMGPFEE